ncbi:TIGR02281 family clan AA aspartic protease [Ectothiorhodospira mobilis]|nr:TIGR02281 family clan AA aspartic protease [Ectothiorhodospira mobilis]
MLSLLGASPALALDVRVVGVFGDRAVLEVDGTRRVLSVGESSPEGVTLEAADGRNGTARVRVEGRVRQIRIGERVGGSYAPRRQATARIHRDSNGAFTTTGAINGHALTFLVDTGASAVVLNAAEARRLGIDPDQGQSVPVRTASGLEWGRRVRLDRVQVSAIRLRNVPALVLPGREPRVALLGMSFLERLEMRNEGSVLVLEQRY